MGLLSRRRSAEDERRVLVALTAKGAALRSDALDAIRCIVDALGMPETEIARLTTEIRALRDSLDRAAGAS